MLRGSSHAVPGDLPRVVHDPTLALDQTLTRLEAGWFTPHGDDTGFDLHPLPMREFLAGMAACGEPGRFIDLGCGVGTKLLVAHLLGWAVVGVERHADYADAARRLVPEATVVTGDVLDVSLDGFDVVYSYRLMVDLDAQHELNRRIVARMRPGALFFCAGSDPVGLEPVGLSVWRV